MFKRNRFVVCADLAALSQAVAEQWSVIARHAAATRGAFYVALSGGSTPRRLYDLLSQEPYLSSVPWQATHVYFGDERCVPPDHPDSNYRMAREAFLDKVNMPSRNVHRIVISEDVLASAERYARELKQHVPLKGDMPQFDLVLLGMGDDGHTASLFPGTDLLKENERVVGCAYVEKLKAWRISITFPVINRARNVFVLAAGKGKAELIRQLTQEPQAHHYPIQNIEPLGEYQWFIDQDAAEFLS